MSNSYFLGGKGSSINFDTIKIMSDKFGDILIKILDEKKITPYKLSKLSYISKGHIYKIVKNENEPSLYILNEISKAIKFDVSEYYKISRDFDSLEHYESFKYLRELIETNANVDDLEVAIFKIDINGTSKGIYRELFYYVKALVKVKKYKNYDKSLSYCFEALSMHRHLFSPKKIEKYITSDISYSIISLIQYNCVKVGLEKEAIELARKLIKLIENIYYNNNIPNITIPTVIFRTYIIMLNNLSDSLLNNKIYDDVILYCEKGIKVIKQNNSSYGLLNIFDLLFQAYYCINEINKAKVYYEKAKAACIVNDDLEYLSRIEARVDKNYQNLR